VVVYATVVVGWLTMCHFSLTDRSALETPVELQLLIQEMSCGNLKRFVDVKQALLEQASSSPTREGRSRGAGRCATPIFARDGVM
jgi:hypothetical protein